MKYKNIFEFQDANETVEEKMNAFREMSEDDARQLILTCGMAQGKIHYRKMYRDATGKQDFMVTVPNKET